MSPALYPLVVTRDGAPKITGLAASAAGLCVHLSPAPTHGPEALRRACVPGGCLPFTPSSRPFDSIGGARRWLRAHEATLHGDLDRIAGRAEFVLTLVSRTDDVMRPAKCSAPQTAPATGAAYLRAAAARAASQTRFDIALGAIAAECAALTPEIETRLDRHAPGAADLSLLAPAACRPALAAAAPAMARRYADILSLRGSGPWPPFTFAAIAGLGRQEAA